MNRCYLCKQYKAAKEFYRNYANKNGLATRCKSCELEYFRLNKLRKREIVKKSMERPEYIRNKKVYFKQYYKNHPYPEKLLARSLLHEAVRKGKIKRKPCEVCKAAKVEAHHPNYSEPLKVKWLCRDHHEVVHHSQSPLRMNNYENM